MEQTNKDTGLIFRDSTKGFTLIEVLLALALFSVVLGALYGSFFMAHRAATGTGDALLRLHEVRTVLDMLRREVEAAIPGEGEDGLFVVNDRDFYGAQASELFFSTNNSPLAGPGRLEYYVRELDGRLVLIKRLIPPTMDSGEAMEAEALEEVESFTVEVLQKGDWLKTWQNQGLPEEVRITVAVPLKDRVLTLREAVRPRTGRRL